MLARVLNIMILTISINFVFWLNLKTELSLDIERMNWFGNHRALYLFIYQCLYNWESSHILDSYQRSTLKKMEMISRGRYCSDYVHVCCFSHRLALFLLSLHLEPQVATLCSYLFCPPKSPSICPGSYRKYNCHWLLSESWNDYVKLVGVESVFFLGHVLLLNFVEALFLCLFLKIKGVLLFIERGLLLSEYTVDEAVGHLFWI